MERIIDKAEILKAIKTVPPLSPAATQLLQISAREDHDLIEIVNIVKCDSALTTRVLQVVNSVAFGLLNKVESIDRAISYLGERLIVSIALESSAGNMMNKPLSGYEGNRGDLWKHDLKAAIASREIAQMAREEDLPPADLAFTAGLLHDIGKAVISDFLAGTSGELLKTLEENMIHDYLEGERELLGFDHTQTGYEVAQQWNLPEALQMAVRYHHHPAEAPIEHQPLVYAVHLGDILAMMGGSGTGADTLNYTLDSHYTTYFDIGESGLERILLDVDEEFRRIEESMLN